MKEGILFSEKSLGVITGIVAENYSRVKGINRNNVINNSLYKEHKKNLDVIIKGLKLNHNMLSDNGFRKTLNDYLDDLKYFGLGTLIKSYEKDINQLSERSTLVNIMSKRPYEEVIDGLNNILREVALHPQRLRVNESLVTKLDAHLDYLKLTDREKEFEYFTNKFNVYKR